MGSAQHRVNQGREKTRLAGGRIREEMENSAEKEVGARKEEGTERDTQREESDRGSHKPRNTWDQPKTGRGKEGFFSSTGL